MPVRSRMRCAAIVVTTLAACAGLWSPPGWAEQTAATGDVLQPCPGAGIAGGDDARRAAELMFRRKWLSIGFDHYSTYELRPPPRNPFDVAAAKSASDPIVRGTVWVQGIACRATSMEDGRTTVFAYAADVLSFHEGGAWSRPMRGGVLAVIAVSRTGERWHVQDVGTDIAVFIPGAHLAAPLAADIPAPDRKLGVPCAQGAAFVRGRCVPPPGGTAARR